MTSHNLDAVRRRQKIGRWVHDLWTEGGSLLSGLAEPWFDGRLTVLGRYVTFQDEVLEGDSELVVDVLKSDNLAKDEVPTKRVDRIHRDSLTYDDFVSRYMQPNRPVIIQGLANDWGSTRKWTIQVNDKVVPNLEYLRYHFGNDRVKVMEQASPGFGPTRPLKREMSVAEYAEYWQSHHANAGGPHRNKGIMYLKDYKFFAAHPNYKAYLWPHFFRDDWLNHAMGNAYKFVYLGPTGSSTVLHADVLRSYSWSTNVCGRKRWYLIPPERTHWLYDSFGQTLATHLHADEGDMATLFPGLRLAREAAIEVIQEPGETIFVPSDWFHTVENLEPTLSINHNWINGYNLGRSWNHLKIELASLRKAQDTSLSSMSNPSADNSQVMDDLVLFWHVISRRIKTLQPSLIEHATEQPSLSIAYDRRTILLVLRDYKELIATGTIDESEFEGVGSLLDGAMSVEYL